MYSGKDLAELSGYTSRVYSLLASLHALDNGIYQPNPRPETLPPQQVSYLLGSGFESADMSRSSTIWRELPVESSSVRIIYC